MSSELTPLDEEDNAAVDMLLEIGDVNSWDISWDLDADIMDVLDVVGQEPLDQQHQHQQQQLQQLQQPQEQLVEQQQVVEVQQQQERQQQQQLQQEQELELGWSSADEQDLIEHIPQSVIMEESYVEIEMELAQLDGYEEDEEAERTQLEEVQQAEKQLQQDQLYVQQVAISSPWTVVAPLTTSSTVDVLRLCFARIAGNEYRIYDALNNAGYQPMAGPPLIINGLNSKLLEQLPDGLQLTENYVHIFPYSALAEHVKQMIQEETGADVAELLNNSDCQLGIELVPDAEWNIMCVGRRERVQMEFHSHTIPMEQHQQQQQQHSGINIFGEPTRISLTIANTEIVLANEQILEMSHKPEINIFFYANSNCIYVLNGRTLFEHTELGKHVLPISNIDLIPFSPPHSVSIVWDAKDD